jgi:hypothetical protein
MEGPDALRDYYRQWEETFEKLRGRGAARCRRPGCRPRPLDRADEGHDAEIDIRYAIVFTTRDGKIATGREYFTRGEALEAAGLSE